MKKQIYLTIAISGVLLLLSSTFNSCIQEGTFSKATIETNLVTSVTEATAICGGVISGDGGSNVTARGVCWSTSPNPTIENDTTIDAAGTGQFSSLIKGLSPSTTYYVRAYAVNKGGAGYGLQIAFTTKTYSITTTPISVHLVTATSAVGGGNIISDGESLTLTVKDRGVCWNTFPSPTIANSKTSDGAGGGRFTSYIDSLTVFTTYYIRAYATNSVGTIYGNEVIFTTLSGAIGLITDAASDISAFTATCGGNITADGGAPVKERGLCWNTSPSPTTANNKTANGSGTGAFTTNISGLKPCTTYYVRTYGINSVGTSYGNEVSFTTLSIVILLTTNTTSLITAYTATSGGTITSDGGAAISERGLCWNTSPSPTIANNKTASGSGTGTFMAHISNLTQSTSYYVRAYAINSAGAFYGNEVSFLSKSENTVTDIDGNVYHSITIGTQTWMVENLKTTKYNDGTSIPYVSDGSTWSALSTPGYSFYNNNVTFKDINGAFYNWYTVNTGKLAPTGWHVPTDAEWTKLENYLIANGYNYDGTTTGNKLGKSMAATSSWFNSSTVGNIGNDLTKNNTSGFAGFAVGWRNGGGSFGEVGGSAMWWSSTESSTSNAWARDLGFSSSVDRDWFGKRCGFSVRCVRDY